MELHIKNKRALVTGSSRGLGYAIAELLASEGCRVAINSRNEQLVRQTADKLAVETGAEVLPLVGDLSLPDVPDRLVAKTVGAFGGIDFLVTNASGPPSGRFDGFDDSAWYKANETSLLMHVRIIRSALPFLRQSDCASVVTMTSYSVKQPIPNLVLSNSIRAATAWLTKSLALEFGQEGIRFNCVLPGWTLTERVVDLMAYRAKVNGTTVEEETALQAKETALGRMANPVEVASAVGFLLSPAASYITGILLPVDGGVIKGTF